MPGKRKRPIKCKADQPLAKKFKTSKESQVTASIHHPILSLYYPQVKSLREYLLQSLPTESRLRRRKFQSIPYWTSHGFNDGCQFKCQGIPTTGHWNLGMGTLPEDTQDLSCLLDTTLIGVSQQSCIQDTFREQEFATFSQQLVAASGSSAGLGTVSQSEVGPRSSLSSPCGTGGNQIALRSASKVVSIILTYSDLDCRFLHLASL